MDSFDFHCMRRAIELAKLGVEAAPNPKVGCVIRKGEAIIGEGWHRKYGGAHAEVNAVKQVGDDQLLEGSTVYVTLEPCSHYGKTPPCADLLIQKKVSRVVIACTDPNPLVAGRGVERIKGAGIQVDTGLLAEEARRMNRFFLYAMEHQLPYITLKWAQTGDGFIAREDGSSKWISNSLSRRLVHKWRGEHQAILVGASTAVYDDPALTVRDWSGANPLRILIDPHLRVPANSKLLADGLPTIVYHTGEDTLQADGEFVTYRHLNVPAQQPTRFIRAVLDDLFHRSVHSLFVEGGRFTLEQCISENLWNEAFVFTNPRESFGKGIPAPDMKQVPEENLLISGNRLAYYLNVNKK
jgi:diaminohydroxyphosphoribosylaminopyrimidine deaminase / 5-amino-6-(5-phosphoribosylamino)uracil reductase